MLDFGQKRTIGIAALVAEPGCDLILAAPDSAPTFELWKEFQGPITAPTGRLLLDSNQEVTPDAFVRGNLNYEVWGMASGIVDERWKGIGRDSLGF